MWPWKRPLFDKFFGVMSGLSLGTLMPNLKSVALTFFELLAFNAQKFRGSRDHGQAPFWKKFLEVMPGLSLGTLMPNLKSSALIFFELLAFNSYRPATHTQKHRHTSNEHIISAIHFVHLAEIIIIILAKTIVFTIGIWWSLNIGISYLRML